VNYCRWEVNKDPTALWGGARGYCHPNYYRPTHNTLYRNNGDGTFTMFRCRYYRIGAKGMSVTFADYDGDGYMDAFVANDTTRNFLFHNLGGKRFEEVGEAAGVAYGASGAALSGMGADFRDVNNDGLPDIWHTSVEFETFPLYANHAHGEFTDLTVSSGIGRSTSQMSGWGNGVFDFDNDGWKDLFVARSNVLDNISALVAERRYPEPNSIFKTGRKVCRCRPTGPDQKEAAHRGVAFGI
jgi:hypothetical protein